MASAAGSGSGKGDDDLLLLAIGVLVLIVILAVVFWKHVVFLVIWMLRAEAFVLDPFIQLMPASVQAQWDAWQAVLAAPNFDTWAKVRRALSIGGGWFRVPAVLIGILVAVWALRSEVTRRWSGSWSLRRLVEYNTTVWPRMSPTLGLLGDEAEKDRGPWTRAKTPVEWAVAVGAIRVTRGVDAQAEFTKRGGPSDAPGRGVNPIGTYDPVMAWKAFAAQLGPLWDVERGVFARPFHERMLYAVLVARIMGGESEIPDDPTAAARKARGKKPLMRKWDWAKWLDAASTGFVVLPVHPWWRFWNKPSVWGRWKGKTPKQVRFELGAGMVKDIDDCCRAAASHPEVQRIIGRHAYVGTVMSALLEAARERFGALATGEFRWLKVLDRTLYYALDQVGRRVAWTEAAGVRAHMALEVELDAKETTPGVMLAVTALFASLWQEIYVDEGADVTHTGINVRVFQWTDPEFEPLRAAYAQRSMRGGQ
jgi:hypothetical protein